MNKCVEKWNTNVWMNECHTNFTSSYKYVSNVFSIHDINVSNVKIMNEQILHDFHR
jgi:hypothetical protein